MTPLARILSCYLPRPLRLPALAAIYALMLAGIVLASRYGAAQIIYIDVRGR